MCNFADMSSKSQGYDYTCVFEEELESHRIVGRAGVRGFLILNEKAAVAWDLYKTFHTHEEFIDELEASFRSNLISQDHFLELQRLSMSFDNFMREPSVYLQSDSEPESGKQQQLYGKYYYIRVADQDCFLVIQDHCLLPRILSILSLTAKAYTGKALRIFISGRNPWSINFCDKTPIKVYTVDDVVVHILDILYQVG